MKNHRKFHPRIIVNIICLFSLALSHIIFSLPIKIIDTVYAVERETVTVSRVIDGDTIVLNDGRKVRYIGIDTPETVHPTKNVQCFGKQASNKNRELVLGKTVELEKDISETDRYGRLLRYVYLDGVMINHKLVAEGYATTVTYPPDVKYKEEFSKAQAQARQARLGLWGNECNESSSTHASSNNNASSNTNKMDSSSTSSSSQNNKTQNDHEGNQASTQPTNTSAQKCPSNCSEAKSMGMVNITPSHPCWQEKFDGDKDGVGCESDNRSTNTKTTNKSNNVNKQTSATPAPTPVPSRAPTPEPTPPPTSVPAPAAPTQSCPNNCTQAKAMGMANMTPSHPCWQSKFDRDKDGIGCED